MKPLDSANQLQESNQTVLIVDDAKENIVILCHLLKDQADIIFATNGSDGLAKVQSNNPDLILLDISMPGMNGFEVLRQLQENPETKDIPVIFVTGVPDTYNEEKGLTMGAVDYVTKPFAPAVVRARVCNQLKLRRLTKRLLAANTDLTRMAMTDPLTGAFNRRHFMQASRNELERLRRHSRPASMIMLDIDNFKEINDCHGHDVGDQVLIHTAKTCTTLLRINDVFGRIGGEEFAVLLPETEIHEAGEIAKRLCRLISNSTPSIRTDKLHFTASFGVSQLRETDKACDEALKRADLALYKAKQDGRNRVVIFEQEISLCPEFDPVSHSYPAQRANAAR